MVIIIIIFFFQNNFYKVIGAKLWMRLCLTESKERLKNDCISHMEAFFTDVEDSGEGRRRGGVHRGGLRGIYFLTEFTR